MNKWISPNFTKFHYILFFIWSVAQGNIMRSSNACFSCVFCKKFCLLIKRWPPKTNLYVMLGNTLFTSICTHQQYLVAFNEDQLSSVFSLSIFNTVIPIVSNFLGISSTYKNFVTLSRTVPSFPLMLSTTDTFTCHTFFIFSLEMSRF